MYFYRLLKSGARIDEVLVCVLAMLLAAVISIVCHELAHGYAALKCGDNTAKVKGRLTFNPLAHFDLMGFLLLVAVGFGWAKPVPIDSRNFRNHKKGMLIVSCAGIVTNIILALLSLLVLFLAAPAISYYFPGIDSAGIIFIKRLSYYFLVFMVSINFMLAFFNLLPVYPLDGFRIVNELLPRGNKYSEFMYRYGLYVMFGIILLSYIFDRFGLWYLDIFGAVSRLINKLLTAVMGG